MIKLYGYLAKRFPKQLKAKARNARECIKAYEANYPGFKKAISKTRSYAIVRGRDLKHGKSIQENELDMNFGADTWHIIPKPIGYGSNKGIFTFIVGVVLIVASFYTGGATLAPGLKAMGVGAGFSGFLGSMGLALALGGIAQMMSPSPQNFDYSENEGNKKQSYLLNNPNNLVEAGSTIPVAYGEVFIGSVNIGAGLSVKDIVS
jgi:predicted phage tail protein